MRAILVLLIILLPACANLRDDKGNTVVAGYSFGRDIARSRQYKATFSHPLTLEEIYVVHSYSPWVSSFLIPGMTEIEINEVLSSSSNVEGFLTGLAKIGGTLVSATESIL